MVKLKKNNEKGNTDYRLGVKVMEMDVTNESSMVKGIATILEEQGRIDVLINNAGFGSYGAIEDVPLSEARYQLEVNVFGAARLSQLVIPSMRRQHSGKIINISSIGGKFATPLGGWYHTSKFALEGLSDSLRNEVRQFGIDVIVIEPGGVKSEWGGIARDHLLKISGGTVYKSLVDTIAPMFEKTGAKNTDPLVIVDLVRKAIAAKKPKIRYAGGYLAAPVLFLRKILTDRAFDKVILSQLK